MAVVVTVHRSTANPELLPDVNVNVAVGEVGLLIVKPVPPEVIVHSPV